MFYRISNTASRKMIEEEFDKPFKYPKIYRKQNVINGFDEASIPVICSERPDEIQYGIWGLLPEQYRDDWRIFQNSINTLNITGSEIEERKWYSECLERRRCLILATGFFTSHFADGEMYPFLVYHPERKPMAFAGIYTILEDGFITCSLVLTKQNKLLSNIQNLYSGMPLILEDSYRDFWLSDTVQYDEINHFIKHSASPPLKAHSIAKEFFKRNIHYDSMLEPVSYKHLQMAQF